MKQQTFNIVEPNVYLTQNEIETIYFAMKKFIKLTANVDKLYKLDELQRVDYRNELNIIDKFSKL